METEAKAEAEESIFEGKTKAPLGAKHNIGLLSMNYALLGMRNEYPYVICAPLESQSSLSSF